MIPNFEITKVFEITARNMLVLTGRILSGTIDGSMSLVNEKNNMHVKINSIEMINSKDDELIALTFRNKEEYEMNFLKALEKGSIALVK